jgi:hypothetical protein
MVRNGAAHAGTPFTFSGNSSRLPAPRGTRAYPEEPRFPETDGFWRATSGQLTDKGNGRRSMNILLFLPPVWAAVTAFIVAACRAASLADGGSEQVELEPGELVG